MFDLETFGHEFRQEAKTYFTNEDLSGLKRHFIRSCFELVDNDIDYLVARKFLHDETGKAVYEMHPDATAQIVLLQMFERIFPW